MFQIMYVIIKFSIILAFSTTIIASSKKKHPIYSYSTYQNQMSNASDYTKEQIQKASRNAKADSRSLSISQKNTIAFAANNNHDKPFMRGQASSRDNRAYYDRHHRG